jgi:hypothetical protein
MAAGGRADAIVRGLPALPGPAAVRLDNRGFNSSSARVYEALDELVKKAILRKSGKEGFVKAEGAEIRIVKGGK